MDDNNCAVCAEPLEWTGYGPCGHHSSCSKCIARLRFVLDDNRCAICRQSCDIIFITRHLGKYTMKLRSDQLYELRDPNKTNNYFHLESINAYFDTEEQYEKIKKLCSHTHPILNEGEITNFKNISDLKKYIENNYQKYFCDLCLTGRKVFACEQILYTRNELVVHNTRGDETGILAQSGFKGHPKCGFCNTRFYSETEIYAHNQSTHETCFICKKQNPDKFLYYRNYNELARHFIDVHHPCPHPDCLEKKFIVFESEVQLKAHTVKEHPDMYDGLSKSQMRETLKVETNFHFMRPLREHRRNHRHHHNGDDEGDDVEMLNDTEAQTRQLTNAEIAMSLTDADFPSISGNEGSSSKPLNSNNVHLSRQQWVNHKKKVKQQVKQLDFPKLPSHHHHHHNTISSSRNHTTSSSNGVQRQNMNNRVNNKQQLIDPNLREFPSLPQSQSSNSKMTTKQQQWASSSMSKSMSNQTKPSLSSNSTIINKENQKKDVFIPTPVVNKSKPKISISDESAFPSLNNNNSYTKSSNVIKQWGPSSQAQASSQSNIAVVVSKESSIEYGGRGGKNKKFKPKSPILDTGPSAERGPHQQQQIDEFPDLPQTTKNNYTLKNINNQKTYKKIITYTEPKFSQKMKEANKRLFSVLNQQLDDVTFRDFRTLSNDYLRDGYTSEIYHKRLIEYGLSHIISELTSLCPDEHKRFELLIEHRKFIEKYKQNTNNELPSFVTLEMLEKAFENSLMKTAWTCTRCQLVNAPSDDFCEKCDALREKNDMKFDLRKLSLMDNVNMAARMEIVDDHSSRSAYRRNA